jgi:hypothetical protein
MAANNARFAKPLRDDEELDLLFTWRETRRVSKVLTAQDDRTTG